MTTFKANRKFPNPITVTDDPRSHTLALQQIIEALNIGQRRTKEVQSSYVRVHELVDAGLIEVVGSQLKLTNTGAAASTPQANGASISRAGSAQSVSNATFTALQFDTEDRDDGGFADLVTYDTRLTIPTTGWYAVQYTVAIAANATGLREFSVQKNGSTSLQYGVQRVLPASASGASIVSGVAILYLSAADYVELVAYQSSGGSLDASVAAGLYPRLAIHSFG